MEIICCDSASEAAQMAFRLRYKVYGHEIGVNDPDIDHKNQIYVDQLDKHSKIYVAIKDGEAIATVRALYDRDYSFSAALPEYIRNMLGIDNFINHYPGTLAISTKFAISPNHRGSLAANLVTAKMFKDFQNDNINFVFSWCAPHLFNFYSQLGFHMYARSISDKNGLWTPIVLPMHDWRHLKNIRSPLFKQIDKSNLPEPDHSSVQWFRDNYGESLGAFVADYDADVLEKIFAFSGDGGFSTNFQDVSIFNSIAPEDIKKIIGSGKLLRFSAGQAIIEVGQITSEMFIVVDGEIKISFTNSDSLSFKIGPGQAFGEISMLSKTSRSANCVASTDAQLVIISRQNLIRLMKLEPEIATQLLFNLSSSLSLKLRRTNEFIATSQKLSYWQSLLLEIRTRLNISQDDLAQLLSIEPEMIVGWEKGTSAPSHEIQKIIEKIASDKNITSLGGMVELVRISPSRIFIVDENYFVIAASRSSEWIDNTSIQNQLSDKASSHFNMISNKLTEAGFWTGLGGHVLEYDFIDHDTIWHSIITSVSIRDRIYAVVQQTVSNRKNL